MCARHQHKHFAVINPKLPLNLTTLGVQRAGVLSGGCRQEPVGLPTPHILWPVAPFIHLQINKFAILYHFSLGLSI